MSKIRISYHVVCGDQVDPLVRSVSINQNKNISDLRKAIATKEAVPGVFITIWKPEQPSSREHDEFVKLFEDNSRFVDAFCEDIVEELDAPVSQLFATSTVAVVTFKPIKLHYHLVTGDTVDSSHTVSISPNFNVDDLREYMGTRHEVGTDDVRIWKLRQGLSAPTLSIRLSLQSTKPLEHAECENLTAGDWSRTMSDIFSSSQSHADLVVIIPGKVEVFYYAVRGGEIQERLRSMKIGPRNETKLSELVADAEDGGRDDEVVIWKPRDPAFSAALPDIFSPEKELPTFCDKFEDFRSGDAVWNLFCEIQSRPVVLLATMPSPITFCYYRILEGKVDQSCSAMKVSGKDDVFDLRRRLAIKENVEREDDIGLFKPRKKLSSNKADLAFCECGDSLTNYCDDLMATFDTTSAKLLGATSSKRSTSQDILIVTIYTSRKPQTYSRKSGEEREAEDVVGQLNTSTWSRRVANYDSPSQMAKTSNYIVNQDSDHPILDGRYGDKGPNCAPPIELYHPVYARLVARIRDSIVAVASDTQTCAGLPGTKPERQQLLSNTLEFMQSVSRLATREILRSDDTRKSLRTLLGMVVTQGVNPDRSTADHIITSKVQKVGIMSEVALAIIEERAELGQSSDPSVQGGLSYLHYWKSRDQLEAWQQSICPSFLIGLAGPWICICGAIWTTHVVVQRLTPYYWIGYSRTIDSLSVRDVARLFYALQLALHELEKWYAEMTPVVKNNPAVDTTTKMMFPLATSCVLRETQQEVKFRYLKPFKRAAKIDPCCVTFLVEIEDTRQKAVVKFVEGTYGTAAHDLLADHEFAPQLLAIGPVWADATAQRGCRSRQMLMMEYFDGKTCMDLLLAGPIGDPDSIFTQVESALKLLHEKQMVHGDIRRRNILVGEGNKVKIVDFDWAGKIGEVEYPLDLNTGFPWPEGVKPGGDILAAHDLELCERLKGQGV